MELGAFRVLDLGCGTGTLAITLASSGRDVVAVDPAGAMLDVARAKSGADSLRWIQGDATSVRSEPRVDVVTLTGNAAQAIVDEADWHRTLEAVHHVLVPDGHFVFETRELHRRFGLWNREQSYAVVEGVESWEEVTRVEWPLVVRFHDGLSGRYSCHRRSTLRFRERAEVEADLRSSGFFVADVRDAPDRPGRELVFLARA